MKFNPNARLDTSQVQDRRGGGGGGGGGLGGTPGGKGGLAVGGGGLGLVVVIVIVLINAFSGGGGVDRQRAACCRAPPATPRWTTASWRAACRTGADANTNEDCAAVAVINSVQGYWADALAASGTTYQEADTVFFNGSTRTGCGHRLRRDGPVLLPARRAWSTSTCRSGTS